MLARIFCVRACVLALKLSKSIENYLDLVTISPCTPFSLLLSVNTSKLTLGNPHPQFVPVGINSILVHTVFGRDSADFAVTLLRPAVEKVPTVICSDEKDVVGCAMCDINVSQASRAFKCPDKRYSDVSVTVLTVIHF